MAKVLMIDDDVDLVEMNKVVLEQKGHQVRAAYSGGEAIEALKAERPDVVVLDVMMETTTAGFEVARHIQDNYPGLPTILLTGVHEATGVAYRFTPDETWLPVLEVIDKPFAPAKLAEEIEKILGKKGG